MGYETNRTFGKQSFREMIGRIGQSIVQRTYGKIGKNLIDVGDYAPYDLQCLETGKVYEVKTSSRCLWIVSRNQLIYLIERYKNNGAVVFVNQMTEDIYEIRPSTLHFCLKDSYIKRKGKWECVVDLDLVAALCKKV